MPDPLADLFGGSSDRSLDSLEGVEFLPLGGSEEPWRSWRRLAGNCRVVREQCRRALRRREERLETIRGAMGE